MAMAYLVGAPIEQRIKQWLPPKRYNDKNMHLESFHQHSWHHHPPTPYFHLVFLRLVRPVCTPSGV